MAHTGGNIPSRPKQSLDFFYFVGTLDDHQIHGELLSLGHAPVLNFQTTLLARQMLLTLGLLDFGNAKIGK
jgi:hypothetical protein